MQRGVLRAIGMAMIPQQQQRTAAKTPEQMIAQQPLEHAVAPSPAMRKTHTSYLTPHTSHLTPHTSHLTPHTSHHKPLPLLTSAAKSARSPPCAPPPPNASVPAIVDGGEAANCSGEAVVFGDDEVWGGDGRKGVAVGLPPPDWRERSS